MKLEFRPTGKFADKTVREPEHIRADRERAVEQHRAGRRRLCRQDLSQARGRHQSRDRDGTLPDRGRRLCQYAGAARQRRTCRRRATQRDRHRRTPLSRTRATPGRCRQPISTALSRSSACCRPASDRQARARNRPPICATCRRPDGVSPRCTSRWPAATMLPDFAPGAVTPEDVERWIDDIMARAERVFDGLEATAQRAARSRASAGRPVAVAAARHCPIA